MKKIFKSILVAFVTIAAIVACAKEFEAKDLRPAENQRGKINVNISAILGELTPADETKASLEPVMRLTWKENDTIRVFGFVENVPTELGELYVTPTDNKLNATLTSGDQGITAPDLNSKVSLIYWSGADSLCCLNGSNLEMRLACADTLLFMAYGQLDYKDENSLTGKIVPFEFATSLMRISMTGLYPDDERIDGVMITGLDTLLNFNLENGTYESSNRGSIMLGMRDRKEGVTNITRKGEKGMLNIGVIAGESSARRISIYGRYSNIIGSDLTNVEIQPGSSYVTVCALKEQMGSEGRISEAISNEEYVFAGEKKWSTQNLYLSSRMGEYFFDPSITFQPHGGDEGPRTGDYFQWGATENYCEALYYKEDEAKHTESIIYKGITDANEHYTSICSSFKYFTFLPTFANKEKTYYFGVEDYDSYTAISPFLNNSQYTLYTANDGLKTLAIEHDTANSEWEGTWRMPTKEDFQALKDTTVWVWSTANKAIWVCNPGDTWGEQGTTKVVDYSLKSFEFTDKWREILLILPASGYGEGIEVKDPAAKGYYWTSELDTADPTKAYCLKFYPEGTAVKFEFISLPRCCGLSIRPVSD